MVRTKDDFKNIAKSGIASRAIARNRPDNYDESIDGGNAALVENIRGADLVISQPVQNATRDDSPTNGSYRSTDSASENSSYRELGSIQSRDRDDYGTSGLDIPIRNISSNSDQYTSSSVSRGATVKTRTSGVDTVVNKAKGFLKNYTPKTVNAPRKQGGYITASENNRTNRAKMKTIILWTSENIDYTLSGITKGHREVEIWSDITDDDAEILTDLLFQGAEKSAYVAQKVRQVLGYYEYARAGSILGPRVYKTVVLLLVRGISLN